MMRVWDYEMMTQGAKKSSYVTDGLILWLDGIQNTRAGHNAASSVWEDLSGNGHDFTATETPTWENNCCLFDGVFMFETPSNFPAAETVEVYYQSPDGSACIFTCNNGPGIYEYGGKIHVGSGNHKIQTYVYGKLYNNLYDVSYFVGAPSSATINGTLQESSETDAWTEGYGNLSRIGGRINGSYRNQFRLYSLRFYDRRLSDEEVLQNYNADVERYGI